MQQATPGEAAATHRQKLLEAVRDAERVEHPTGVSRPTK